MYENNNFSGYGTGNENTTGTFSGADLNETRTANSYGMKIIVLPRVQQEAPMVTPLIRWAEPQAATIRSLRKPKNMAVTSGRQW